MCNINKDNVQKIVDNLYDELIEEQKNQVFIDYTNKFNQKISNLGLTSVFSKEIIEVLFENSTFIEILKEDPEIIFEYSTLHWSNTIILEIENVIDFNKMYLDEKLKSIGHIESINFPQEYFEDTIDMPLKKLRNQLTTINFNEIEKNILEKRILSVEVDQKAARKLLNRIVGFNKMVSLIEQSFKNMGVSFKNVDFIAEKSLSNDTAFPSNELTNDFLIIDGLSN